MFQRGFQRKKGKHRGTESTEKKSRGEEKQRRRETEGKRSRGEEKQRGREAEGKGNGEEGKPSRLRNQKSPSRFQMASAKWPVAASANHEYTRIFANTELQITAWPPPAPGLWLGEGGKAADRA